MLQLESEFLTFVCFVVMFVLGILYRFNFYPFKLHQVNGAGTARNIILWSRTSNC